ncbi:gp083 [Rhodococcus phage ReqiPoco6]|uniref:Gp083 n=1 Tax=Rhodococcus phage ReqiPoco6 TaxID=691964 RepID=D4P7V1_9CAUD|nr:gp083 [Rhodococcus phage ReqiPoco6]ADD81081.1 gp083 [Rhodococcus phage ReqiPoco6]
MISDPCRPEQPNELYFVTDRFPRQHRYYWILQTHEGSVIGTSNETYVDKASAMRNAITLFGKEILAGYHHIVDDGEREQLQEEMWKAEKHNHISREVKLDGTCPSCLYVIATSNEDEKRSYLIANARPKRLIFNHVPKHSGVEYFWRLNNYDGDYLDSSRMPFTSLSSAINNSISRFGADLLNELKIIIDAEPDICKEVLNGARCMFPNAGRELSELTLEQAQQVYNQERAFNKILTGEVSVTANTGPDRSSVTSED